MNAFFFHVDFKYPLQWNIAVKYKQQHINDVFEYLEITLFFILIYYKDHAKYFLYMCCIDRKSILPLCHFTGRHCVFILNVLSSTFWNACDVPYFLLSLDKIHLLNDFMKFKVHYRWSSSRLAADYHWNKNCIIVQ